MKLSWLSAFLLMFIFLAPACSFLPGVATPTADFILSTSQSGPSVDPPPESTLPPDPSQSTPAPETIPTLLPTQAAGIPGDAPDFSGLKVVYTNQGDLWIWEDGQARQLTESGYDHKPILSDDGTLIAFTRLVDGAHSELWVINATGGAERRLVSIEDLDTIGGGVRDPNAVAIVPYSYQWTPGSHTLAFNTQQVFQGPGQSLLDDLNLVDADSGELNFLLLAGWGGAFTYSPDGSLVALSTPDAILLMDASGENYRTVLTYERVLTYSEYRYYAQPVWAPDGSFLRVAFPPVAPLAGPDQVTEIWRISADGTQVELEGGLTAVPFFEDLYGRAVAFSPDLERLAYLREKGQPAENLRQLRIAYADAGEAWAFHEARLISFETWAADSQHFVFTTGEDQQAWLGNIDGGIEPFLDDPYGVTRVRWVDEQRLLYLRQGSEAFDFILADMQERSIQLDSLRGAPPAYDFFVAGE
jgi:Tol biopolymer transport system component